VSVAADDDPNVVRDGVVSAWRDAPAMRDLHSDFHSGEAHIWRVATALSDDAITRLIARLPEAERRRAERYRHGPGRSGFVVARVALRELLGRYLGTGEAPLELRYSAAGKPSLDSAAEGGLHFSLAHCGGVALLAFARIDVGVDVERVRRVTHAARIAARVFPAATQAVLAGVAADEWWRAFFAAWTQREALVKAVGGVLLATHDPLDFVWPPPPGVRRFVEAAGTAAAREWTIAHLPTESSLTAAVVAAGAIERVRLATFTAR
jgi:4'-phosphopantetheinyl transferase